MTGGAAHVATAAGLWPAVPAREATLGVVVPAHDEARTLATALGRIVAGRPARTVLVDDGSIDGTAELAAALPGVAVVRHPRPRGYGAALLSGFAVALELGLDPIVTLDADLQHEPERVAEIAGLLDDADIVTGSRWDPRSEVRGSVPGQRSGMNARVVARVNELTRFGLSDAMCGMRAYRAAALAALDLDEPGYGLSFQIWLAAARLGLRIRETPVPAIYFDGRRPIPGGLDDPVRRWEYYEGVFERSAGR